MGTNNYIPPTAGTSGSLPTGQPATAGLWLDGGVLTMFDGVVNNVVDFNEGSNVSTFGTDLGDI